MTQQTSLSMGILKAQCRCTAMAEKQSGRKWVCRRRTSGSPNAPKYQSSRCRAVSEYQCLGRTACESTKTVIRIWLTKKPTINKSNGRLNRLFGGILPSWRLQLWAPAAEIVR